MHTWNDYDGGLDLWCCNIHLVAEHPWQWSEATSECEAEEGEGEEGEVIQEGVVAGMFHDGIKF